MYWSAVDMTESQTAINAAAATRNFFRDHPDRVPSNKQLLDVVSMYSSLKSLRPKIDAAMNLANLNPKKTMIKHNEGSSLYNGSWFTK